MMKNFMSTPPKRYKNAMLTFLLLGVAIPFLGGCFSMYSEGNLSDNRVQVKQERFFEQMDAGQADGAYIANLGKYYMRHGDGVIDLSVTYTPKSNEATAMLAGNEVSRLVEAMRKNGMRDVNANILPVQGYNAPQVIISFASYVAQAPKDCDVMPGIDHTNIYSDPDYKLGCSMETVFARQVSRPKDLKGQSQSEATSDGRRASNTVELYRTGIPNEALGGESSSGD